MAERKAFSFYRSYFEAASLLDDPVEQGEYLMAVCKYAFTGERSDLTGASAAMFALTKPTLDSSRIKAEAGTKGGLSKHEANTKQTQSKDKAEAKQTASKPQAINEIGYMINEIENEIENESKDIKAVSGETTRQTKSDMQAVVDAWNKLGVSQINRMSADSNRCKMLKARLNQYGLDEILRAIELVGNSDFLMGRAKDFLITFDWFIKPNNFDKILSGNYNNRSPGGGTTPGKPKTWAELAAEMEAEG